MTKYIICLILGLSILENTYAQDFIAFEVVEIVNENHEEAIFYYESNWAQLRKEAKQLGFIANFAWYHSLEDQKIYLITDFGTKEKWELREQNFQKVIKNHPLRLLNDKKPPEFRKRSDLTINKM